MGNYISPGTNTDLCSSLEYMVEFTPHIHCSEKSRTIPCDCISYICIWQEVVWKQGCPSWFHEKIWASYQTNFNTLRPRRNEQHFADDIFKRIFFNKNVWISITISLKFVPKGPINNIPALVQIMAWRRPGDKPLSEPMMVRSTTHICVTRPQWVKMASKGETIIAGFHMIIHVFMVINVPTSATLMKMTFERSFVSIVFKCKKCILN